MKDLYLNSTIGVITKVNDTVNNKVKATCLLLISQPQKLLDLIKERPDYKPGLSDVEIVYQFSKFYPEFVDADHHQLIYKVAHKIKIDEPLLLGYVLESFINL